MSAAEGRDEVGDCGTSESEAAELRKFLCSCRSDWSHREQRSVQRKLSTIGVRDVKSLVHKLYSGTLNEELHKAGERRFAPLTIALLRAAAAAASCEAEAADTAADCDKIFDDVFKSQPSTPHSMRFIRVGQGAGWHSSTHDGPGDDAALHNHICRGLDQLRDVGRKAQRQSGEDEHRFASIRVDLSRISAKINQARHQREHGRFSTYGVHPAARQEGTDVFGSSLSGAPSSMPPRMNGSSATASTAAHGHRGAAAPLPSRTSPKTFVAGEPSPRCARGAQSGFRFGVGGTSAKQAPSVEKDAGPQSRFAQQTCPDLTPAQLAARESVRVQLVAVRTSSETEKRRQLKRLLVQWHPDRNPDNVEVSTAMFQFIQQEKDKILGA